MLECSYRNDTPSMVVLKCIGTNNFHVERVVMPTETYLFTAPEDSPIELWRLGQGGQICQERSDVQEFKLNQEVVPPDGQPKFEENASQGVIRYSVTKAQAL